MNLYLLLAKQTSRRKENTEEKTKAGKKKKKKSLILSSFPKPCHNWYHTQNVWGGGAQLVVIFSPLGLFMLQADLAVKDDCSLPGMLSIIKFPLGANTSQKG